MNELQKTTKAHMLTPAETSRAVLFREVANREINDTVTPDFFLSHYMDFVRMVIANGQPSTDTYNTYKAGIESFLGWCLKYARVNPFILK